MTARTSWSRVLAWRMHRQYLTDRAGPGELVAVASRLCGLHAQMLSSAELSLWARVEELNRAEVTRALWEERSLVKLWAMRGTLHLLPSSELGLWLGGMLTYGHYGLRQPRTQQLVEVVGEVLRDSVLTREQFAEAVGRRTGSTRLAARLLESWGSDLKPASLRGQLCFAPNDGARVRFTHPSTWIPGGVAHGDTEVALAEIARRYLGAFGPATVADIRTWWEGAPSIAERMVRALGDEAVTVEVDGQPHVALAEHADELASFGPVRSVRLLPAFDPWVVTASRTSSAIVAPEQRHRVYRGQGWFSPVLLVAGEMRGVWRSRRAGKRLVVELDSFAPLAAWARRAAEHEAERLGDFLGARPEITWV